MRQEHVRTVLSEYQYSILRAFADAGPHFRMSMADAGKYKQTSFGSLLKREYIAYSQGFYLTAGGRDAISAFDTADVFRRVASMTLTCYFQPPRPVLMKPVRKRRAAAA